VKKEINYKQQIDFTLDQTFFLHDDIPATQCLKCLPIDPLMCSVRVGINPFKPKYLEWNSPSLDLEYTIQICRGERVKLSINTDTEMAVNDHFELLILIKVCVNL